MLMLIEEQAREMEDTLAAPSLEPSSQRGSSSREHDAQPQPQPLQPQPQPQPQQPQGGNGAGGTSELQEIQLVEMRTVA